MTASVSDLQRRSAALMQRVEAGETVELTRHDRPVAEIRALPAVLSAAEFCAILTSGPRLGKDVAEDMAATLKELDAAD